MLVFSRTALCLLGLVGLPACGPDVAATSVDGGAWPDASGDAATESVAASLEVTTRAGRVAGKLSQGVRAFLGIPFGAPPIGDLRLKEPRPAPAWTDTRDTKEFAAPCAQNTPSGASYNAASSEDCLYLNVWAPATDSGAALPVMVWTYGGAYVFGGAGAPYNGEALVSRGNVILVTYGYRLGPLGYFAHPALTAEAADSGAAPTNFGMLDQRLALEWVRDNIAAFGGDQQKVTLFGESAGGNSVSLHLVSEGSRGLFQRAIIESGLVIKPQLTLSEAEVAGARYADSVGCAGPQALSCLRALTPAQIMSKAGNGYVAAGGLLYQQSGHTNVFQPTLDGRVLKEQPAAAVAAGRVARVPVLHGVTRDEGVLFHTGLFGDRTPSSNDEYQRALANRFGDSAATIVARYPDYASAFPTISNEAFFRCPTGRFAHALAALGIPNYVYRFSLALDAPLLPALANQAFHSAELPYLFGNDYLLGKLPPANRDASHRIMDYWTRFARTGDPNGAGAPTWPPYQTDTTLHLELAPTVSTASDLRSGCDFWDPIVISAP